MPFKSFTLSSIVLILLLIALINTFSYSQKTDVIILYNGDKITGEIKQMITGQLKLSTNNMGTIYIEWEKIAELWTDKIFELELTDGRTYYGSLNPGDKSGTILVKGVTLETTLFMKFIVRIARIRESFWDILDGYIKFGVNFNKGSEVGELNFGADLIYKTKTQRSELILNSIISTTKGNPSSRNQNISYNLIRDLEHKWFWTALASAEENTSLGLQLRATIGGGIGNNVIQTNKNWLYVLAGVTVNREWYTSETDPENNLQGLISSRYLFFIYDSPSIYLNSSLNIFPYLTNFGRIRIDYKLSLNWEIINNFYWDLSFNFNSDNQPQSVDALKIDYNISSGIKYDL